MESISDDEKFEVEHVLGQRKRKGVLEYLVHWKGAEDGDTWEPAKTLAVDCAQAVQNFLDAQKAKKRSESKTRSTSRSRSRSSSRSRKSAETKAGKSTRSRSRGRSDKQKTSPPTTPTEVDDKTKVRRSLRQKAVADSESKDIEEIEKKTETNATVTTASSATTLKSENTTMSNSSKKFTEETEEDTPQRSLRSSTIEQREKLEVQRVHNEQRPVREDDSKPRSPIWKVADYIVIVMFVISLFAAIFLFLEKFVDLAEFKKQAFPNFGVLRDRLDGARQHLLDLCYAVSGSISDGWLYLVEQIKMPQSDGKGKAVPK